MSAASAARTASWSRGASPRSASFVAFSGLATISTAPSSRARIAAAVPGPAWALTTTIGRGDSDMMYPMAPRPSSSGSSRSIVTTAGSNWWTLRTASNPSRAVAITRNGPSPPVPPSTSARTRRIKALSSTTRTVGLPSDDFDIAAHRADLDAAVGEVEPNRAALIPPHRFALDRDRSHAQGVAGRDDVALAHLQRPRRHQGGEHRGAAGELGDEPATIRGEGGEPLARRPEQGFDLAEQQQPAGRQRLREGEEQPLLHRPVEVDDDVAADDQVVGRIGRALTREVVAQHAYEPADLRDRPSRGVRGEVAAQQVLRHLGERHLAVLGGGGALQALAVDVGGIHAGVRPRRRLPAGARRFRDRDGDRVRLLSRGAPRRPRAHAPPARPPQVDEVGAQQRGPRFRVAIELGDVDGERVEQLVVLVGVFVEQPTVVVVAVDAARAHADRDAPLEALLLIRLAADPPGARDLLGERLERRVVLLRRHDRALRVSRLDLTSSWPGLSSSARRHSRAASSRSFRLYAMLPSLK